ncbi:MAG: hypothetical protein FK730_06600 [Asgard group archaeon]|nr:hypothetical protein [Asgard group archaeon]
MEYNDIITYNVEAILLVDDEAWNLIVDSRYHPIIEALRKGPLTVKDLEKEYNNIVAKKIDEMPLDQKEKKELKEKTRRKGKTLYKYLYSLEKKGLVVQAGKRVKMGQTASETLYGRPAKLFLKIDKHEELQTEKIKKYIPVLGKIICLERNKKDFSKDCLANFLKKTYSLLSKEKKQIFIKHSNEISQIASDIYYDELSLVLIGLEFYLLLQYAPELMKDLEKCFK